MDAVKVDNRVVQEADNMAKETHLSFRDCLDILMNAHLRETAEKQPVIDNNRYGATRIAVFA